MAEFKRWPQAALLVFLLACLVLAGWLLAGPRPPMLGLGLALAAASPLLFLLVQRARPSQVRHHPILVSGGSGLGCVMVMVGIQRFGEQHQWILLPCLGALIAWMAYQRWILRRHD